MEQSMKGSNFVFDYVSGMHEICNKISTNRCGSNTDSPKCIKLNCSNYLYSFRTDLLSTC